MSDKKISELTALTAPDGTEELVVNDSGTSKKITQTNLLSTALPLAGGTMTGTIAGFTSTGIDDNATSTAITIDASENVIINSSGVGNGILNINGATGSTEALMFQRGGTEASRVGHSVSGDLTFSMGSGVSEKVRILSSGGITFNGDTAAANALDDYETGTWSPTLCLWDGTVFHTATDQGYYVKVGSLVYITIRIYNATTTTNGTVLKIKNLPYASGGDNNQSASPLVYSSGTGNAVKATIVDGADYIGLSDTHDGFSNVLASEIGSGARIYTSLTYTTI